jgi:hypothetical protein
VTNGRRAVEPSIRIVPLSWGLSAPDPVQLLAKMTTKRPRISIVQDNNLFLQELCRLYNAGYFLVIHLPFDIFFRLNPSYGN